MEAGIHELTAGYALDALDPEDRARFEAHLSTCDRCQEELASFWEVSGALAYGAGGPDPPPSLRDKIIDAAREERPKVVPLRARRGVQPLTAAASIAAVVAVALGAWGFSVSRELDDRERELAVLADPNAKSFSTSGGEARLVVTPTGRAALVVHSLDPAPSGKDYEIWVFENERPHRAGLFDGPGTVLLERDVAPGGAVAVTLEREGGVGAPTTAPLFTAYPV